MRRAGGGIRRHGPPPPSRPVPTSPLGPHGRVRTLGRSAHVGSVGAFWGGQRMLGRSVRTWWVGQHVGAVSMLGQSVSTCWVGRRAPDAARFHSAAAALTAPSVGGSAPATASASSSTIRTMPPACRIASPLAASNCARRGMQRRPCSIDCERA
eukprot:801242-Prymnesium_polylepis.1